MNAGSLLLLFCGGLVWWSLLEYLLHRFVFHRFPETLGRRHLRHHTQLNVRRLALAPLASAIGGMALHVGGFVLIFGTAAGLALAAGTISGYLAYEWVHFATHYRVPKHRLLKRLRRHHMIHHHAQPHARYGVTTTLWDRIFRTLPPAPGRGRVAVKGRGKAHLSP